MGLYIFRAERARRARINARRRAAATRSTTSAATSCPRFAEARTAVRLRLLAPTTIPGMQRGRARLLARHRDHRRLLGRLGGPRLGVARASASTTRSGRSTRRTTRRPPAKFVFSDREQNRVGIATDSMVSEGCIISGGRVDRSILGPRVRVNSFSRGDRVDPVRRRRGRPPRARPARHRRQGRRASRPGMTIGYDLDEDRRALHRERGRRRRRAEGREARLSPRRPPILR